MAPGSSPVSACTCTASSSTVSRTWGIANPASKLEGAGGIGQCGPVVSACQADQAAAAVRIRRLDVRRALFDGADECIRVLDAEIPLTHDVRMRDASRAVEKADEVEVPITLRELADLGDQATCTREVAGEGGSRLDVVLSADDLADQVDVLRELDARLQIVGALGLTCARPCRAHVDQRLRADVVQPQLGGQAQSLASELDGAVAAVREHLVARRLAQDGSLNARRRHPRDELTRVVHVLAHAVTPARSPLDLREQLRSPPPARSDF